MLLDGGRELRKLMNELRNFTMNHSQALSVEDVNILNDARLLIGEVASRHKKEYEKHARR